MFKEKKWNTYTLGVIVSLLVLIYILFEVKCFGSCNATIIKPLFAGLFGLLPTSFFLIWFTERIFILWLKHIAWWFLLLITYFIYQTSPYGGILSIDRSRVALFWMAILFIITFIYALIMNKRLKAKMTP